MEGEGRKMAKRQQAKQAFLSSAIHTLILLPPFAKWLARLKDTEGRGEVHDRIAQARGGNFGDVRQVNSRDQIWEMRIHTGPGYRAYFTHKEGLIYLLLVGGNKDGQKRDVKRAIEIKKDYFRRGK
jgi:putative addiction module killer protein